MSMIDMERAGHPWEITDDQGAEWAIRIIEDAQRDTDLWRAYYDHQYDAIKRRNDEKIARMQAYLEAYFDKVPHHASKTQETYTLPSAKLVRRQQAPEYKRDQDVLVSWLSVSAPELIRTKTEPDWERIKRRMLVVDGQAVMADTGEIIAGVTVEERPPKFAVVPNKQKMEDE